ncbi:MAG: hypothetical protein H6673_06870 [Anaerolineales bacterium]|nr:hypothetical protein [Anaerolineales bacterium]
MQLSRRTDPMHLVMARLGIAELPELIQHPTINEAIRVTIYYHDNRAPASVATLRREQNAPCQLDIVYDRVPRTTQLTFTIPTERYLNLLVALRKARFDTLDDESDLPLTGADLWLVERLAGTFHHDIVLCPTSARGHLRDIVLALRDHLPEAVREGA